MERVEDLAKALEFDRVNDYFDRVMNVYIWGQQSHFMAEMKKLREIGEIENIINYLEEYRPSQGCWNPIYYYAKHI